MSKVIFSKDNFGRKHINNSINTVVKMHFGFIDTDCTLVKNLLTGISYSLIDSAYILNKERLSSFNNLLTKLAYD